MLWFGRDERHVATKTKALKWRQWVLVLTVPLALIDTIFIISALTNFSNYSNDNSEKFSFYDLPDGLVRSKIITAASLEVVMLAFLWADTIYSVLLFHHDDRVHRRCVIQASLSVVVIVLAAALKAVGNEIATLPSTFDTSATRRPELTAEQFSAAYGSWRDSVISTSGLISFIIAIIDAAIHAIVIVFWLWLLPARHRLPNRYEPVIEARKRKRVVGNSIRSSYELVDTADRVGTGPLEVVFQEHERTRLLNRNNLSAAQKPVKEPFQLSASSGGPQFDPPVRYWMVNPLREGVRDIIFVFIVFFFYHPAFEIVLYSLTKTKGLRCPWYCYLAFAFPWPIVLWMIIIIVLLRMKVPFNRRVFAKGPRLDVLITITALPFIPLWFLVHISRFAGLWLDGDYTDSDPGRSRAYNVIIVLKMVEIWCAIRVGITLSIGHTKYRFYTAGRSSSKPKR
ncbi:hypothetical protein F5Y12DRAFT_785770 [Xylaria sp. FL1777]|nr:hypothetical protein F5Y12DRAFT_785770 [Xylaria sp. FL1777]